MFSADGTGPADQAHIFFRGQEVLVLTDKRGAESIRSRSLPLTKVLNRMWRDPRAGRFTVMKRPQVVVIESGGADVIEVFAGDADGRDPSEVAQEWAAQLQSMFDARVNASGSS